MEAETFLIVDVETLTTRPGGPAIAGIWLVARGGAFPDTGRSDFVVVVLGWWAGAILKTILSNRVRARVHFMDGPHAVEITLSSGMLRFRLISRDREVGIGEAVLVPFVDALISQSRKVLQACRSLGWWSTDADTLASLIGDLKRAIS